MNETNVSRQTQIDFISSVCNEESCEEGDVWYQRSIKMFVYSFFFFFFLLAVTIEAEGWIDPQARESSDQDNIWIKSRNLWLTVKMHRITLPV